MIICSCNVISHQEISRAVEKLKEDSPRLIITPGLVFKVIEHQPKCGTCISNIIKIILNEM